MEGLLSGLVFSIAVPIGAYHPRLSWALESLKVQGVTLEVAVLDASGDPRVAAVLDQYSELLTYRRSGPDAGQAAAIAEGWDKLKGNVFGWLNADDFLYPGALKAAENAFLSRGADVVTGDSVFLDREGRYLGYHPGVGPPDVRILTSNPITQPSTFFRRDLLRKVGGIKADLHYTMDWELWVRMYKSGARFVKDDRILSGVTIEAGTKTMGFGRQRRSEVLRILAPHADAARKARVLFGMALQYIDDSTGLVSRALDLAGSSRASVMEPGRIIAHRQFNSPSSLMIAHFNADGRVCPSIVCDVFPGGSIEMSWNGRAPVSLDWPTGQLAANTQIEMPAATLTQLRIHPDPQRKVRLSGVFLKKVESTEAKL